MKSFEELDAWQRSRELAREVYRLTRPAVCGNDYAIRDQMRRAAISVMSNIAEGFERDGTNEFIQFLSVAKGSAGEIKAQSYVLSDAGYVPVEEFQHLYCLADETGRLIGGLMRYLAQSDLKGTKLKFRS